MSKERKKDKPNTLETKPFACVALPRDAAEVLFPQRAAKIVDTNITNIIKSIDPDNQYRQDVLNLWGAARKPVSEQAVKAAEGTLYLFYETFGNGSFQEIAEALFADVFPTRFRGPAGDINPANLCVGDLLSLISLVDPKKHSFEDCVSSIITAMHNTNQNPFDLGVWVDDAENLRGSPNYPELLIDAEEVVKFRKAYLDLANPADQNLFRQGYEICESDLVVQQLSSKKNN